MRFWGRAAFLEERHSSSRMTEYSAPALLLDGCANQAAPFGPGAIIVTYCRIPEQVVQHEPGMAAALANATIRHHFLLHSNPFAFVQGTEPIRRLVGAIFAAGLRPSIISRARNIPPSLR